MYKLVYLMRVLRRSNAEMWWDTVPKWVADMDWPEAFTVHLSTQT
jgi:hypothetical protein